MVDQKKILLIVPPVIVTRDRANFNLTFPIGLAYIAAVLEEASYEVVILDTIAENVEQETPVKNNPDLIQIGMTFEEIKNFIAECSPDFIGISSMFSTQSKNAYGVAEMVKSVNKGTPVIFGGAYATAEPEKVLENKNVDIVVLGEGEMAIAPLLKAIENGNNLDTLESIAFRNSNNGIILKPKIEFVDVDRLPYPARHLFQAEKYFTAGQRHGIRKPKGVKYRSMPILTSRGCPFSCNFCSAYQLFGKKYRPRNVEDVLKEIDDMVKIYKVEDIYLSDDQFLLDRKRVLRMLDGIIEKDYKIVFDAPNGISPWLLNEEIIRKMKQAGFWRVPLAIESGNKTVLKEMINKPVKINKLPELVSLLRKYKLDVMAFIVVGNFSEDAVETFSQIQDTFELMRKLKIRKPAISYISPHPGSAIFEIARKKKYINKSYLDNYYNEPSFSTSNWNKEELKIFTTVQRVLCVIDDNFLFLPIKILAKNFGGFCLMGRYRFIYNLYLISKAIKRFYFNRVKTIFSPT